MEEGLNLRVEREPIDEEGYITQTSSCQLETEECVEECFRRVREGEEDEEGAGAPVLMKKAHISFLNRFLRSLPQGCTALDSSRPWLCYWITHSLYLLNSEPSDQTKDHIIDFLARCESERGGFGGGPGQDPHMAPTYAAVLCLATLATPRAYRLIHRERLKGFLEAMRVGDGSFYMHQGGEVDIRAVYCAVVIASLTNLATAHLFHNSADWILRCQTYEGGFAGFPGMEAHGGYSFCAIAALHLLQAQHRCNVQALLRWAVNRQMRFEGGFQGRTNKLVDVCYSFWQSSTALLATLSSHPAKPGAVESEEAPCLFHSEALQEYILICCQHSSGGFMDKPNLSRDSYHTCYALGGLSLAQHTEGGSKIIGPPKNYVPAIHPVYNVGVERISAMLKHYRDSDATAADGAAPTDSAAPTHHRQP